MDPKTTINADNYRRFVGMLMCLSQGARPDLSYPVQFFIRKMHNPTDNEFQNATRTLRYLKSSANLKLQYFGHSNARPMLDAWSDSD